MARLVASSTCGDVPSPSAYFMNSGAHWIQSRTKLLQARVKRLLIISDGSSAAPDAAAEAV